MTKRHYSLQEERPPSSDLHPSEEPTSTTQSQAQTQIEQGIKMERITAEVTRQVVNNGMIRGKKISRSQSQSEPSDRPAANRVRISPAAVAAFEYVYAVEKKPNDALIKVLCQAFGETYARVKVWFQNRRGRERGGAVNDEAPAIRKPSNLPPSVLQTLLAQNPTANREMAQEIGAAIGSSDLSTTTAQAVNAMLTVNSISKFWGNNNHLLANEIVTAGGGKKSLEELEKDPVIIGSPFLRALLERVIELRQGVIDQFVMTDGLLRGALPGQKKEQQANAGGVVTQDGTPLLAPISATFGNAVPSLSDIGAMNWEHGGYTLYTPSSYVAAMDSMEDAFGYEMQPGQFPFGEINDTRTNPFQWEFINEDFQGEMQRSASVQGQNQIFTPRVADVSFEDFEPSHTHIPISTWIIEAFFKSIQRSTIDEQADEAEVYEAISTAHLAPTEFNCLSQFLGYYDVSSLPEDYVSTKKISVRVSSTLEGYAGWILSGRDFARVLMAPLNEMFGGIVFKDGKSAEVLQVYVVYDLRQHVLSLKGLFRAYSL